MTETQIQLVRSTYQRVQPRLPVLAAKFYQRLFELEPKLRRLFHATDMLEQRRKFISVLSAVVSSAHEANRLHGILTELASRHTKYGVKPADLDVVGSSLIWALDQELGSALSMPARQAWVQLYEELSSIMRAAMTLHDDLDSTMPLNVRLIDGSKRRIQPPAAPASWVARIRSLFPSGS